MSKVFFALGVFHWMVFAFDIEYDRDVATWYWLFAALYFFVNSYMRYQLEQKNKAEHGSN